MDDIIRNLQSTFLFKNMNTSAVSELLDMKYCTFCNYRKNSIIAHEGDKLEHIGFIISGSVEVHQIGIHGEHITISTFEKGDSFGTAMYSINDSRSLYSLRACCDCQIFYISFKQVHIMLRKNPEFNSNFIEFLSLKIIDFKKEISMLQMRDVRSRLVLYLSAEYSKQKTNPFMLKNTKVEIANIIGVARPSVSRELKRMEEAGIIELSKHMVTLKNADLF